MGVVVPDDCQRCGACCFGTPRHVPVDGADYERLGDDAESLVVWFGARAFLRLAQPIDCANAPLEAPKDGAPSPRAARTGALMARAVDCADAPSEPPQRGQRVHATSARTGRSWHGRSPCAQLEESPRGAFRCGIYERRPKPCRELERGSPACLAVLEASAQQP
jgi:Fe-S-cluster containining protein